MAQSPTMFDLLSEASDLMPCLFFVDVPHNILKEVVNFFYTGKQSIKSG